jgi:hypothetical protein
MSAIRTALNLRRDDPHWTHANQNRPIPNSTLPN